MSFFTSPSSKEKTKGQILIDTYFQRDEKSIDVYDQIITKPLKKEKYDDEIFVQTKSIEIPEAISEQYDSNFVIAKILEINYSCYMGLFSEIQRAWVSMDNRLYLWNFMDGSDFYEYDELDQVILTVGLVPPKPGIFKEDVKFLLIVATTIEIVFIAVTFSNSEINLLPTNYSISTDNARIQKIVGTKNGRIFICGDDGCLYEVTYYQDEGWFSRKKIQKLNHSQNFFGHIIPSFLRFYHEYPVKDVVIDETRNVLYTLSENNSIDVYDLGSNGENTSKVCSYSNLGNEVIKSKNLVENLKLVTLFPITHDESSMLHLVAISNKGDRYYFSTNEKGEKRPQYLIFKKEEIISNDQIEIIGKKEIQSTFYRKGVFLLSNNISEEKDSLIGLSIESKGKDYSSKALSFQFYEKSNILDSKGKIQAISEIPKKVLLFQDKNKNVDDLVGQLFKPLREYVCLSNNEVQILEQLRPIDRLKKILKSEKKIVTKFKDFKDKYLPQEILSMCLHCASVEVFDDPQLSQNAKNIFFKEGGEPIIEEIKQREETRTYSTETKYSDAHNGAYLYFTRLIRPLWKQQIIITEKEYYKIKFSKEEIGSIKGYLEKLYNFFKKNPDFYTYKEQVTNVYEVDEKKKLKDQANQNEKNSLTQLFNTISKSIQLLNFMELLSNLEFHGLLIKLESKGYTFAEYLFNPDAKPFMFQIVQAIVEKGQSSPILENLLTNLQLKCKDFFDEIDIKSYVVMDNLKKASNTTDKKLKNDFIKEAFEKSKEIAEKKDDISSICNYFMTLNSFSYSFELALLASQKIKDPSKRDSCYEIALKSLEHCLNPTKNTKITIGNLSKTNIPTNIIEEKDSKNEKESIFNIIKKSKDKNFNFALISFLKEKKIGESILLDEIQPLYLEEYLHEKKDYDFLSKYYQKTGKYDKSAEILIKLATGENMDIETRIKQLYDASLYVKASQTTQSRLDLRDLEERIDVSRVQQKVLEEIKRRYPQPNEMILKIIQSLNLTLMNITEIWKIAKDLKLDSRILVLSCSGEEHARKVVNQIWNEFFKNKTIEEIQTSIVELGSYIFKQGNADTFFPLDLIIWKLEIISLENNSDKSWVPEKILEPMECPFSDMVSTYHKLFDSTQSHSLLFELPKGKEKQFETRLLIVIASILNRWVTKVSDFSLETDFSYEKISEHILNYKQISNQMEDSKVKKEIISLLEKAEKALDQ